MRRPGTMFLRGLLALVFAAAYSPGALLPAVTMQAPASASAVTPTGRRAGDLGRRHHRVPADSTACRCCCSPTRRKSTITVNITYLVGSRHEDYGETGMAHLLEHLVFKGTPKHPNIPQELTAHGSRPNGTTWIDRTNYFETFCGHRREPRVGARSRGRPHGQLVHRQEGSRQRDDRRAQRVRDGREQPDQRAARAHAWRRRTSGTTTASRPSARAPTSRTCRSTGCRRFYRRYYQPDNAVLVVAGKFDEGQDARAGRQVLSADPAAGAQAASAPTPPSRRRTASARSRCGASATCSSSAAVYHVPAGAAPGLRRRSTSLASILGDTPSGPAVQGAGRDQEGRAASSASTSSCASRRLLIFGAEVRKEHARSTRRATRCCRPIEGPGRGAAHRGRGRARPRAAAQRRST